MDNEGTGELQELMDALFTSKVTATSLDLITQAEVRDISADAMEVVELLPSGSYLRAEMADQLNSIISAHSWGSYLGLVS